MIEPENFLNNLPRVLRTELIDVYSKIVNNYVESRWEPSELNGGKFCEVIYSICKGALEDNFPAKASKPSNMVEACKDLENIPPDISRIGDRSLRILIPRMLPALYEVRNNRGVGHVGGDVDPNYMDSTVVYSVSSWIMAEMVRIFHSISVDDAQKIVDTLVERKLPLIWQVDEIKRVLNTSLSMIDQTLLLLYSESCWIDESKLCACVEHSNTSIYRRDVLKKLHKKRLLEYRQDEHKVHLSPSGAKYVEEELLN